MKNKTPKKTYTKPFVLELNSQETFGGTSGSNESMANGMGMANMKSQLILVS